MSSIYLGPILSAGPWTQQDRDTINRRLNSLIDNAPGYIRLTRDDGKRINPQGGAVLSSNQYQTILRSDIGKHVAVLASGTAHDATPSTSNAVLLVDDAAASLGANLALLGTARRITGDFSNGTFASRVLFQTSTANGNTLVGAIPNGAGTASGFYAFNNATPSTGTVGQLLALSTEVSLRSAPTSGTALPLTFWTNNASQLAIDAAGLVTATQNLAWKSGTAFAGTLDHANTANRTYTYPDGDGTVVLTGVTNVGDVKFGGKLYLGGQTAWSWQQVYGETSLAGNTSATVALPLGRYSIFNRSSGADGEFAGNGIATLTDRGSSATFQVGGADPGASTSKVWLSLSGGTLTIFNRYAAAQAITVAGFGFS